MAGIRAGMRGTEGLPGYTWLILLVLAPYLLHVFRTSPVLVALAVVVYVSVILPMALKGQLPQGSFLWLPKTVAGLLMTRSALHTGLFQWMGNTLSSLWYGTVECVVWTGKCLLMLLCLPFTLVFGTFLPLVHNFYLAFEGFRITSNQVVFFMLCEKLLTPQSRLVSLYFLLFYTVLAYLRNSLSTRRWTQLQSTNSTSMRDFLKLTTWYIAVRLGKGVAMSFVLVMFTMQFNHVEPDVSYIAITFVYFVLTQRKWTGNERVVSWISVLHLEALEQDEEFWVPLLFQMTTPFASACMMAPLLQTHLPLCAVAVYTNVIVPFILLNEQLNYHHLQHTDLLDTYRRATSKELAAHSTCPVCLEDLRVARATPCGHLYHAACLRRCLAVSSLCPMCKQAIKT